jgi:hypothetical protein
MRIEYRQVPPLPADVRSSAERDILDSLNAIRTRGDKFVVNPTRWYAKDGGSAKARVMNRAPFLSKTFQESLRSRGWEIEKGLDGQRIDAYKVIVANRHKGRFLDRERYIELVRRLVPRENPLGIKAPPVLEAYYWYVQRKKFGLPGWEGADNALFLATEEREMDFRIGVEFETGNIASSFRALLKLNLLFQLGKIDVGIFVTSISRADGATKIWPPSNRNGSFEELAQRQYDRLVYFPIWEFGFAPDEYDDHAPYFHDMGKFYVPQIAEGTFIDSRGREFDIYTRPYSRGKILRPRTATYEAQLELEQETPTEDLDEIDESE